MNKKDRGEAPPRRGRPTDPERLRRVIEMAGQHFIAHGYERTSLDAVAAEAGVSKVTIYSHFASKQALYEAAIGHRTERVFAAADIGALDPADPKAALSGVGYAFLALMRDEHVLGQHRTLFANATVLNAAGRGFWEQGPQRLISTLARYLRAAHKAGTLDVAKPTLAADQFLALFLGGAHIAAMLGLGKPSAASDAELVRENVRMFLARYGKAAPPAP